MAMMPSDLSTRGLAKNCASGASLLRMMNVTNRLDRATLDATCDFLMEAVDRLHRLADLDEEKK